MKFLPWFRKDLEAALTIIQARAPGRAHEIQQFRKALANESGILPKRFEVLLGNAMGGHERHAFTEEEKRELGQTLVRLEEYCRDGRPGPKVRGNEYRLMVYLTKAENEALVEYCDRQNTTRSATVRAALRCLLERDP
jgi:hypothetical protein